jgi:hypothetical protein
MSCQILGGSSIPAVIKIDVTDDFFNGERKKRERKNTSGLEWKTNKKINKN